MPSDSPAAKHLDHILENINLIDGFVEGADQAAFLADRKTRHAVLYGLLVISEASRRLPEELKDRHPDIGWQAMAAAGNVYRHEYHGLDGAHRMDNRDRQAAGPETGRGGGTRGTAVESLQP
ncbi:MAG TPA: HepT-like ribonuclease domain-containing protein [Rhodospirillales bacterium]|nr:HepT-like ribonuclease domain-containing protein [Rhodospirillales bacterium]